MSFKKYFNSGLLSVIILFISSCIQQTSVVDAPHRTSESGMQKAVVMSSYPIRMTKNSGIGGMLAGLGGSAIGYKHLGSGAGQYLGGVAGQILGAYGGNTAESKIREIGAQEVTVKMNNEEHTLISKNLPQLKSGDSVMAYTNAYGKPIRIGLIK